MANYGKWIAGVLGWAMGGPIGALLGVGIGSVIDHSLSGGSGVAAAKARMGQRNSFLLSLLVLSSAVMRADGRVLKSELEYVKGFIGLNFGKGAVNEALSILKKLLSQEVNIGQVSAQIVVNMPINQRLQLLHYLSGIAQADANPSSAELAVLRKIASALRISAADAESIFAMFGSSVEDAYRVLEIETSASDVEIKKAYRRMAVKYHPDKVSTLGEDVRKAAEEKFKSVSQAYDRIKKDRGIN